MDYDDMITDFEDQINEIENAIKKLKPERSKQSYSRIVGHVEPLDEIDT